jgi:hypothetical protein
MRCLSLPSKNMPNKSGGKTGRRSGAYRCFDRLDSTPVASGDRRRKRSSSQLALSRTTSDALLSSRKPRKTGWRKRSSRVHSVNLTSQTVEGLTQTHRFISAAVRPGSRPPPIAGRLSNGQSLTAILFSSTESNFRSFSLKPVPTPPANLSLPASFTPTSNAPTSAKCESAVSVKLDLVDPVASGHQIGQRRLHGFHEIR